MNTDLSDMDMQFDLSGLEVKEDKRDSMESWAKRSREDYIKYYEDHPDEVSQDSRSAYKARLDATRDKMEWSTASGAIYLKREEE